MEVINLTHNAVNYPNLNYNRLHREYLLPSPDNNDTYIVNELLLLEAENNIFDTYLINFLDRITENVPVGIPLRQLYIGINDFNGIADNFYRCTDEFTIRHVNNPELVFNVFAAISENHQYPFILVDTIANNIDDYQDITEIDMDIRGENFIANLNRLLN